MTIKSRSFLKYTFYKLVDESAFAGGEGGSLMKYLEQFVGICALCFDLVKNRECVLAWRGCFQEGAL
jgi:hypothetical protein